ncbi:MAG: ABC transporter ATP-binding protein [Candidatus Parcubacteria bacterium]|nr:MAG: ABC transporter ATP-binding protein [Candidatus Parcubacteria bacterium]
MIILEIKNLIKKFEGIYAVNNLSLQFRKGQIIGIIGPNGSGKTTLINLLTGILEIDSGEVIINEGITISKIQPYQVSFFGLTRTFQNVRLFEQMSVLDNILVVLTERNIFASLFERHSEYHYKIAKDILQKVNLWEKRNQLALNLSYGQRKLLEIARALAMKAEIYFFDEPFAGLFAAMREVVFEIIQELKQNGKTIVLVEHDIGLIRNLCDYVFVMDEGKLLAEGKPEEVLEKREVIEAYLGE